MHRETHAHLFGDRLSARVAGDDGDTLARHVDMPQDQRQHALADATEAEDDKMAAECNMVHDNQSFTAIAARTVKRMTVATKKRNTNRSQAARRLISPDKV